MWSLTLVSALVVMATVMEKPQAEGHLIDRRDIFSLEHTIDLRLSAFDDQYEGCVEAMEAKLPELNKTEYAKNKYFAKSWDAARAKWDSRNHTTLLPSGFRDEHAIAILAYTSNGNFYKIFNKAVREAGISADNYLKNFKFKTLHFLLTRALQLLEEHEGSLRCFDIYRGFRDVRYKTKKQKLVRFGQFVSSSLTLSNGLRFGRHTVFDIKTCYAVNVKNFSSYPEIKEVLIPPYEKFMVTNFTRTPKQNWIQLHSVDKLSVYNCEYLKEKKCTSWKCFLKSEDKCTSWKCLFKSGTTTLSSSSVLQALAILWVLVLVLPIFPCSISAMPCNGP